MLTLIISRKRKNFFFKYTMMFENLSDRFSRLLRNISGRSHLTEENIKEALREVRIALLEADVALPVVRDFISRAKESALGQGVRRSLTPGQAFFKIVRTELVHAMGDENNALNLVTQPPAVILMVGLQGTGKTTSTGKLAKHLHDKMNKKVLIASADVYRPAAIQQLEILAHNVRVDFFSSDINQKPLDIVNQALIQAKLKFYEVLLVDTAGRMHLDQSMMKEMINIHSAIKPIETLFVVDAMSGQDMANTAKAFNQAVPLTGIILTKVDGDARGGAALSIRYLTGKPIKFMGTGEKSDALEPFYPDRLAGRILGMGDVLSLIEDIENKIDRTSAEKFVNKLKKNGGFNLIDFLEQLQQIRNLGGITNMINKLPGTRSFSGDIKPTIDDKTLVSMEAIINSMTMEERIDPDIINGSRKKRIAKGSGMQIQDINRLLKQFYIMENMMKKGRIMKIMRGMTGIVPPGGSRR